MNTENNKISADAAEIKDERYLRNRDLILRAQAGDEQASETLIIENTALVKSLALKFRDRGTEFEDLMQIGTIGMLKAISSFQIERGTAFSTYAVPLIVGEIRRHLRDDGLIRVSRGYKKTGITIMREKNRIMTEEGREAGIVELAEHAGVFKILKHKAVRELIAYRFGITRGIALCIKRVYRHGDKEILINNKLGNLVILEVVDYVAVRYLFFVCVAEHKRHHKDNAHYQDCIKGKRFYRTFFHLFPP